MEEAEEENLQEGVLTCCITATLSDRSLHAAYDWALSFRGKAALRYVLISNTVLETR